MKDGALKLGETLDSPQDAKGRPESSALFRSLGWVGAGRAVAAAGTLARYAVFARLLSPYQFGVFGAAMFVLDLLTAAMDPSFDNALVQRKEEVAPFLDTYWVTSVVRGILTVVILVCAAAPLGAFFRQEQAYRVFWAVAPLALLRAMQSPAQVALYRRLEFHVSFIMISVELIISFAVGIVAILVWRDWRGLVAAATAGQAARTALTYWYFPYRPRMRFNLQRARQLLSFGGWVSATRLLRFLSQQLDNLTVAHLLGPRSLGDYQMAFRLGELPAREFAQSVSLVSFAMVPRMDDRASRNRLFVITTAAITTVGLVYAAVMFQWGGPLVKLALGKQWMGALPPLKLLCVYGLFQGVLILARSFLDGLGAPSSSFSVTSIRAAVLAITIYPATAWYGAVGAAGAGLFSVMVPLPLTWMLFRRATRS
jgi:lipopolysaccharide exporter